MILMRTALAIKGEEIHACCWPGYWTFNPQTKVRDMSGKIGPLHTCDQDCCVREYAFETQTFVISSGLYLPASEVPDTFPFKQTTNFNWAMGGSCIAGPFGTYLAEPVFNKETIVYAELDMDDRIIAKNVFDCMGHYSRWDLVSLNIREEGWEPVQKAAGEKGPNRISSEKLERVAKKFKLGTDKLEAILKELETL
jgi:amidase/nitrilase